MLDHSKGWALTDQNILFTSDGGQIWKDVTPSGSAYGKYAYGDFMNNQYAWVVSTIQPIGGNSVNVLRTSDGGQHWQSSTISASVVQVIDPPHFLTTQEGFLELGVGGSAAGSEGAGIFHTTDGGQNWTEIANTTAQTNSSFPLVGHKSGISFKDVYNGWATGLDASNIPWLYVTHDGGHTWNRQSLPPISPNIQFATTPPVSFGNTGFLPVTTEGTSGIMYIYKTTDGGTTWTVINPQHGLGDSTATGYTSSDLYIADVSHAWATDAIGQIWGTSDGFNNWQLLNTQMAGDPTSNPNMTKALSFVDVSYGWGVSTTGGLWQTTDGGKTWSEIAYHFTA